MLARTLIRRSQGHEMRTLGTRIGSFGITFVPTGCTGVVETFGKYSHTVSAGLNFYVPFIQKVRKVTNMVQQVTYEFEVKTKDNIFVVLSVSAQFSISPDQSVDALYKMANPLANINSFLDSEVRAQVSRRDLDTLFTEQEEVSQSVFTAVDGKESVYEKLHSQGFTLTNVLIRHIDPAEKVKSSMNEINASLRLRDAAKNEAEAKYIMAVKEAEADRDRKRLQGEGISQQRLAILKGYQEGMDGMLTKFGLDAKEVVDFVMKTQHLDTLEVIGRSPNCKTLFMNHSPDSSALGNGGKAAALPSHEELLLAMEASGSTTTPPASTSTVGDTSASQPTQPTARVRSSRMK